MRLVIDLRTDPDGRPVGAVRIDSAPDAVAFADWLDLLRLLEACIDRSAAVSAPGIDPSTTPGGDDA